MLLLMDVFIFLRVFCFFFPLKYTFLGQNRLTLGFLDEVYEHKHLEERSVTFILWFSHSTLSQFLATDLGLAWNCLQCLRSEFFSPIQISVIKRGCGALVSRQISPDFRDGHPDWQRIVTKNTKISIIWNLKTVQQNPSNVLLVMQSLNHLGYLQWKILKKPFKFAICNLDIGEKAWIVCDAN